MMFIKVLQLMALQSQNSLVNMFFISNSIRFIIKLENTYKVPIQR